MTNGGSQMQWLKLGIYAVGGLVALGIGAVGGQPEVSRTVKKPVSQTFGAFERTFAQFEGQQVNGVCLDRACETPQTGGFRLTATDGKALDFRMTVGGRDAIIIKMKFTPTADGKATILTADVDTGSGFVFRDGSPAKFMSAALGPVIETMITDIEADRPIGSLESAMRETDPNRSAEDIRRDQEDATRESMQAAAKPVASAVPMIDPDAIAKQNMAH